MDFSRWDFWDADWWAENCERYGLVHREVRRGDTLQFYVQVYQPATPAMPPIGQRYSKQYRPSSIALGSATPSLNPQSLAGWYLQFTAKFQHADQDSQAVMLSKTTGISPNIITPQAQTGLVLVAAGPLNTITLADGPTKLVYDVEGIDGSGNVSTVEAGRLLILPDVSRATSPS